MPPRVRTRISPRGRDRKPHRGGLLNSLGLGSLTLGCLSLLVPLFRVMTTPSLVMTTVYAAPFAAGGLLLGLFTRHLARRHMRHMGRGWVDSTGQKAAETAALLGGAGVGLALAGLLVTPLKWLLTLYLD